MEKRQADSGSESGSVTTGAESYRAGGSRQKGPTVRFDREGNPPVRDPAGESVRGSHQRRPC